MGRTVHRSAVHAMALLGITPIWVWPRQDAGPGLAGRIQADDVAKALQNTRTQRLFTSLRRIITA